MEPGTRSIRQVPYRQCPAKREIRRDHIDAIFREGVIEPSQSERALAVVPLPKKDGKLGFCVDYRRLNLNTIADTYLFSRMEDCNNSLGDATVFSTINYNSGYWQIPVAKKDRDKTLFTAFWGTYCYLHMPIRLGIGRWTI